MSVWSPRAAHLIDKLLPAEDDCPTYFRGELSFAVVPVEWLNKGLLMDDRQLGSSANCLRGGHSSISHLRY
eukprot:1176893-Prorocentrum_minimum.AAC.5